MNFKKILGLFAIATASAGVSSASASCYAAASLYRNAGYRCSYLSGGNYQCFSGLTNSWLLAVTPDGGCQAGYSSKTSTTTFTKTGWVPVRLSPSLLLTR
jgi:hypothetical protein